jgi:hypothetical protein
MAAGVQDYGIIAFAGINQPAHFLKTAPSQLQAAAAASIGKPAATIEGLTLSNR